MGISLVQAVERAAAVERGGARFYRHLAEKTTDASARELFSKLAEEEVQHAEALERRRRELNEAIDDLPDPALLALESSPWIKQTALVSLDRAVAAALQAEQNAADFYGGLAAMTTGETRGFFLGLARVEQGHVERLRRWHEQSFAGVPVIEEEDLK
jgi:rubrerythrin